MEIRFLPKTEEYSIDVDQYLLFKPLIEGFFNNVDKDKLMLRAEMVIGYPVAVTDLGFSILNESPLFQTSTDLHDKADSSFLNAEIIHRVRSDYIYVKVPEHRYLCTQIRWNNSYLTVATIPILPSTTLFLLVFSENEQLTPQDLFNVKLTSQLMAIEYAKAESDMHTDQIYSNRSFETLLNGDQISREDLMKIKDDYPWICSKDLRLFMISVPEEGDLRSLISTLTHTLTKYVHLNRLMIHENYFLTFLEEDQYEEMCIRSRDTMESFLASHHLYGLASEKISDIMAVPEEYALLRRMIKVSEHFHVHYALFYDMPDYLIADMIQKQYPKEMFCHPALLKLMAYDQTNNAALMETLEVYLQHRNNVQDVLDKLFIQRSTLFYRLNKIKELTGLVLKETEELAQLYISLRLIHLLDIHI